MSKVRVSTYNKMRRIESTYKTLAAKKQNTDREVRFMKRVQGNVMDKNGLFRPFLCSAVTVTNLWRDTYKFKMKRMENA